MSGQQINLGELLGKDHKYQVTLNSESSEDARARRDREAADAQYKRRTQFLLFLFSMLMTAGVFIACMYILLRGDAEDKKWATGVVSAMSSGLVGYLVGSGKK